MASASNTAENLTASYTYDSDGLRLTKTINGVEHKYLWQGSKLVSEYYDGKELEFFYDESGNPYAFSYKSSATATPVMYYYLTNLQGDVTGILDSSGTTVAAYTYNAWGRLLSSSGTLADLNPLRYRGYYYDSELEMYYLQSRYYDPEICRFISADRYASTGQGFAGCNMFVYCGGNPILYSDKIGTYRFLVDYAPPGVEYNEHDYESENKVLQAFFYAVEAEVSIGMGGGASVNIMGFDVTLCWCHNLFDIHLIDGKFDVSQSEETSAIVGIPTAEVGFYQKDYYDYNNKNIGQSGSNFKGANIFFQNIGASAKAYLGWLGGSVSINFDIIKFLMKLEELFK